MPVPVRWETRGPVIVLTVDRPEARNAYDPQTLHRLAGALTQATTDGVRAVVLTGAGRDSFSSGADLKAIATTPPGAMAAAVEAFNEAFDDPRRVPVIAAVNGFAIGGGFEVVLRCDLAVASNHAVFRLPEVQRGIVPGGGATLLPARLPMAIAQELAIAASPISANRAYELGLVNRVSSPEAMLDDAVHLGLRIAANGPHAVARTRALLWTTFNEGVERARLDTRVTMADPTLRNEMAEGIASFLEKRLPRWAPGPG